LWKGSSEPVSAAFHATRHAIRSQAPERTRYRYRVISSARVMDVLAPGPDEQEARVPRPSSPPLPGGKQQPCASGANRV
jgi:hypothetical protein